MRSLAQAFERAKTENRLALIGYLPAGYPSPEQFLRLSRAAFEAGLDILEIGLPTGNAVLDGAVIRQALEDAHRQGITIETAMVIGGQALREADGAGLAMVYGDLVEQYGYKMLLRACAKQGIDGILTVGYAFEDWLPFARAAHEENIQPVGFIGAQMNDQQIEEAAGAARGFLYLQSQEGPTGQQGEFGSKLAGRIQALRKLSISHALPIAVGFGVRSGEDARRIAALGADGVVVGTAMVEAAAKGEDVVRQLVVELAEGAAGTKQERL